ncbi:hypothetical protein [Pseudomonas xanthosomatis]|uniref:hypothetical protein n=1 Tax=Pseudomonas xanthosomatis TaxID=2842356 RepID=UPI003511EDD3
MTSVYKKDRGNGVVIYADDYVKSGIWVFDCRYSRLISRHPLPAPLAELEQANTLTIGSTYDLDKRENIIAKAAIKAITAVPGWYKNLRYLYSGLNENSRLTMHVFDFLAEYEGRQWAFIVWQHVRSSNESHFKIVAKPYDPDTYMDYAKALETAARSCPVPQ